MPRFRRSLSRPTPIPEVQSAAGARLADARAKLMGARDQDRVSSSRVRTVAIGPSKPCLASMLPLIELQRKKAPLPSQTGGEQWTHQTPGDFRAPGCPRFGSTTRTFSPLSKPPNMWECTLAASENGSPEDPSLESPYPFRQGLSFQPKSVESMGKRAFPQGRIRGLSDEGV